MQTVHHLPSFYPLRVRWRRHRILRLLLILFAFLVLLEGGLQLAYRLLYGAWLGEISAFKLDYIRFVDTAQGYVLTPFFHNDLITIDAEGFRLPRPERITVICAGDSIPFGAGVADQETYPALLGALNAGVPSYNLRQTFAHLQLDVLPRTPAARVVTIETANDVSLLATYKALWTPELTWADRRFGVARSPFALVFYLGGSAASVPGEPDVGAWLQAEDLVLRAGIADLRQRHLEVVLLSINPFNYQLTNTDRNARLPTWTAYQPYVDEYSALVEQYNALLAAVAATTEGVQYLDSRPAFDAGDRAALYVDYLHHSPDGNRRMADVIRSVLRQS